jgi:galactoside 2-L-fucosyltransferase 1/2
MFTYAATYGIAQRNNMTPVIERRTLLTQVFQGIDMPLSDDMRNTLFGSVVEHHEYGRRGSAYDRGTERLFKMYNRTNVQLRGYFQSWRYFDHVADVVRRNFVFKEDIARRANEYLSSVAPPQWRDVDFVRVGIHVRRGDMIQPYYQDYGYNVPPAEYFVKAMRMFIQRFQRVQFIVCSDDVDWCRANIPPARSFGENVDLAISVGHSQFEDLAILSRCNHVIMSVGSFGWWAAWLANGTTVYYENWPRPSSMLDYHVDKSDYFPSHWLKLS